MADGFAIARAIDQKHAVFAAQKEASWFASTRPVGLGAARLADLTQQHSLGKKGPHDPDSPYPILARRAYEDRNSQKAIPEPRCLLAPVWYAFGADF